MSRPKPCRLIDGAFQGVKHVRALRFVGDDLAVAWNQSSPERSLAPVAEDVASTFANWTKLELLSTGEVSKGSWLFNPAGSGTISNATLVAALGSETDFILRAYHQRGGLDSLTFDQVIVGKICPPNLGRARLPSSSNFLPTPTSPISTIALSRLQDVTDAALPTSLVQDNLEILAEAVAKRIATYQSGSPTTIIGPPASGDRALNEFRRDARGGEWVCTGAGTLGTWKQIRPAPVVADPSTGTIPAGYLIWNVTDGAVK